MQLFVAICEEDKIDDIKEAWSLLDGRVIETFSDNEGCSFI